MRGFLDVDALHGGNTALTLEPLEHQPGDVD
jgi:hypothetical protein